ncbi:ribokinase [Actinomadura citrea]|jgi:ribokinase|uniref:Ribokinase n=1 Tax=Actinomadura citrea TaxID=46158 RepID=A0A7Y9GAW7_9ACTN|nr:ribokinase [Actinomadura citrea]NYE13169.1 ribokinase [Actinomadura citrea]GGU09726.1 ribokinase [Actinomadura citrea]
MEPHGVLVVGSITADVTAFSARFPRRGETVLGDDFTLVLGGKGANQAVASARAGARTWLAGCVGRDPFREIVLDGLRSYGVELDEVRTVDGRTGVAHIRVDASGENDIVITPLANADLSPAMVDASLGATAGKVGVLLLQLEVPAATTCHAAKAGRAAGLTVVLDPAPAQALPDDVWPHIDLVTPNESEATELTGVEVTDPASAERAGRWFLDRGVGHALITLGAGGAVSVTREGARNFTAYQVTAVDTTAAGDAFTGSLGAALAAGDAMERAIRRGMAAGALATTRPGASPSLPGRDEVDALMSGNTLEGAAR